MGTFCKAFVLSRVGFAIELFLEIAYVLVHLVLEQSLSLFSSPTVIFKLPMLLEWLILLLIC